MTQPRPMQPVVLYTKPACPLCDRTKKVLDHHGIEHQIIDVTQNPDALARVKGLGYSSAPVVMAGDTHWSGYQPDLIKGLIT